MIVVRSNKLEGIDHMLLIAVLGITALLILVSALLVALRRLVNVRTGTAAGGCEAAKVEWTEAMQFFFLTEMMGSPPSVVGRHPLKLDDKKRVALFGVNSVTYGQADQISAIGIADVVYDENGRASRVGIHDLAYDERGRIIAVGRVPISYENGRVAMIAGACPSYDEAARPIRIGWDPILYPHESS